MTPSAPERYLRLGLQLGRHVEGIVDSYFGPADLAAAVDNEPLVDPRALVSAAETLLGELEDGWLRDQVIGVRTYAGVLAGEPGAYADELEGCYGVRPTFTDEAVFTAAHERLEELLPGEGTLAERHQRWEASTRVPTDRVERTVAAVIEEARAWTRRLYGLPDGENVDLEIVRGEPWLAFCEYLGDLHSRIAVNVDLPMSAIALLRLAIHETYPGHHAERCSKDHLLVRGRGLLEETLVLVPTPQSLVAEGIAGLAPEVLLDGDAGPALAAVVREAGRRARSRPRPRRRAGPRAVRVGGGERRADAPRRRRERGRGARVSRAVGSDDPRARCPRDPLLQRADVAELRDHLPRRTRALPLVRGRRSGALPSSAHRAGARPRPARRAGRRRRPTAVSEPAPLATVELRRELFPCLLGREAPRAWTARVDDPSVGSDENEPLGPGGERHARAVVHLVEEQRQAEVEAPHGFQRLLPALVERRLLVQDSPVLQVCRELPLVVGVGFRDVDEGEVRPVSELLVERLDVARPTTKRRSGEAAEDEQQRPPPNELHEADRLEVVGAPYGHVRQHVTVLQRLGSAVPGEARDHRLALDARRKALDVAAVGRIEKPFGRLVSCGALHAAKPIDDRHATGFPCVRHIVPGVSKPPTSPYPPDLDDAPSEVADFGDLVDVVATDTDWAGERALRLSAHRAELRRCRLTGAELGEATLRDVTLDECRVDLVGLRHATLERVVFRDCRMDECDFHGATLTDVLFERCELREATFSAVRLERVELRACDLTGIRGADGLRGARMPWNDVLENAPLFAWLAGIEILTDE